MTPKTRTFLTLGLPLLLTDCATKAVAVAELLPHTPHEVYGDMVRLTLVYNTGAAMSLTLGEWSRLGFAGLAVAAIFFLLHLLYRAPDDDRMRAAALALVTAGAMGNLWDRLRWDRGVVDFIDLGIGQHRFWIFNTADVGITLGALLLAVALWREGARRAENTTAVIPDADHP